ncbi:MAG: PspC domain-containing protein [Saprospirales bacterium]|nr:MAG: PspC domain-containing protein [Saprospirales bacterium]
MDPKDFIHRSAFGVCSCIGEKLGIASSKVRIYFIYLSFLTLGSPIIIYLFFAFWLDVRRLFKPVTSWFY